MYRMRPLEGKAWRRLGAAGGRHGWVAEVVLDA
jgi:hypothetical protein